MSLSNTKDPNNDSNYESIDEEHYQSTYETPNVVCKEIAQFTTFVPHSVNSSNSYSPSSIRSSHKYPIHHHAKNTLFQDTTYFFGNLEIVECLHNERFYKVQHIYFPLSYPLPRAVRLITQKEPVSHIGVPVKTLQNIIENGKRLFVSKLYGMPGKQPTMLVHSNCIYDIHVPLHLIFFPKCLVRDTDGTPLLYAGPANVANAVFDGSVIDGCGNCRAYGIYRGVCIAMCSSCSYNAYDGQYGYTGYAHMGIDFYCIPPERRVGALPQYFESTHSLTDIGYTGLRTEQCYADSITLVRPVEKPQEYVRFS